MAPFFSHAASSSSTMKAIPATRKRNHPSPSSRSDTFTRSRSQLFLHRSRSGFLRPDPQSTRSRFLCPDPQSTHFRYQATLPPSQCPTSRIRLSESVDDNNGGDDMVFLKDLKKKTKLRHEASSTGGDSELSRVLMKDLRTRRVYSPQSSVGACSSLVAADMFANGSGVDSDSSRGGMADLGSGAKPSLEKSCSEREGSKLVGENGNLEKAFWSEGQKKDEVNSILSLVLNEYRSDKDSNMYVDDASESSDLGKTESQDEKRSEGISSEKIEESKEELLQMIPPETEIRASTEVKGKQRKQVEDMPLAGNALKNAGEGSCENDSRRNGSVLKSKSALRPRFQGRLFKAPGSVSFKRLFPYLMDIMKDDSAKEELGHCPKDERAMDGNNSRLSLSYQSQGPSKLERMIDSCSVLGSTPSIVSEDDAVVAPVNELSHGNGSELTSSPDSLELDMQFHSKGLTSECLFVPSVKEVGNAPCNDKEDSKQQGSKPDYVIAANDGSCTVEQFAVFDEECVLTTPPDADTFDKQEINKLGQLESNAQNMYNVEAMDMSKSNQENAVEGFSQKADMRKDSIIKSKSVPRSNLHRKLFINPRSFGYKRLLPFLMDFTKDERDHQTHPKEDEVDTARKIQFPLLSQNQGASISKHNIDDSSRHDTIESNKVVSNILVDSTNELCHGNQPKLTSSQELPELPMQLDAREMVHECLSFPSANEHIEKVEIVPKDECLSVSKFDPHSVMGLHCEGVNHVQNISCEQHNSESPPKAQNVLGIDCNVSNLTFEHHSSKEKGPSVAYDEGKPSESLENCKTVCGYFLEGQSVKKLDRNKPDVQDKEKTNHKICSSDNAVVLNHVSLLGEGPRSSPEKVILGKSDMEGHGAGSQKAGSVLKGIVYGARMPSKGKNDKHANQVHEARNSSEIKTRLVINRCSHMELLKQTASYSYKRLLPYLSNTMKDSSCATESDHCPKVQKLLDQTSSYSNMQATPVVSNGHCKPESSPCPRISDNNIDSPIIPYGPMAITRDEEAASVLPAPSVYSEVKGNSSFPTSLNEEEKPLETCRCQSLSQATFLDQPRVSTTSFKRGILKRSPRGCRGLCSCLNCASFHLHAERAFEFSRNQFLDAEEVAHDLIKELSHLRKILERSTESVNGNPILDRSQVKEACREALVAEQLAKDRFSQMNDDLNIHCRISNLQRPRVRFSDHVEQKVIEARR
ncbi:uncharacterized protein LOC107629413 isoform X2 [Arachis ipaensis]|uniref:uncharacterized protein LOC107629413 isoform X2 n=1 Tax=Arachis ipaensis TaxID=130454 RepID=UPI000A2B3473|nr:uncharacterized protein LOC107629413 isoform X2 [Arachis ipaensis]XP_025641424.1 uncharacterized protein LOC112736264 isoform X2 [Arachis hypogaea]QHN98439.1 uncharacterized protein DS421_13g389570 [Arachis hypogaea]